MKTQYLLISQVSVRIIKDAESSLVSITIWYAE